MKPTFIASVLSLGVLAGRASAADLSARSDPKGRDLTPTYRAAHRRLRSKSAESRWSRLPRPGPEKKSQTKQRA